MSRNEPFDKYETVLLIETYIKVQNGETEIKSALQNLSIALRNIALCKGLSIADDYRNYNGMQWQYSYIKGVFEGKENAGKHSPLFSQMVYIYKNHYDEYKKLLDEAHSLINAQPPKKYNMQSYALYNMFHYDTSIILADCFEVVASNFANASLNLFSFENRTANIIKRSQLKTVADLLNCSIDQLIRIRGMGTKSLSEIIIKLRDFVLNPQNTDTYLLSNSTLEDSKAFITDEFKDTIISFLNNAVISLDGFNNEQLEYFNKINYSCELLGKDICASFMDNALSWWKIRSAFDKLANIYVQKKNRIDKINTIIESLPKTIKTKRLIPFIAAYNAKNTKTLDFLLPYCDNNNTVYDLKIIIEHYLSSTTSEDSLMLVYDFLKWLDFDINDFSANLLERINSSLCKNNTQLYDVFDMRTRQNLTLQEIGEHMGLTRERVRQIQKKCFERITKILDLQKYDAIMMASADSNGKDYFSYQELTDILGRVVEYIWESAKYYNENHDKNKLYFYSSSLNAIVLSTAKHYEEEKQALDRNIIELLGNLPDTFLVSEKAKLLKSNAQKYSVPLEIAKSVVDQKYSISGQFYSCGNITVPFIVGFILKNCFKDGFKIADEKSSNKFRDEMIYYFGNKAKNMGNRALDAKVGDVGVLCDRGKYIHPDFVSISPKIVEEINNYIDSSERMVIPYGEIFEALKPVLVSANITNRYYLQGIIKKYGCKYSTDRDAIRKDPSVSLIDELEQFVEQRGIVHKSEILSEFTSLTEVTLGQVISRSQYVFSLDRGYYIHASQYDIRPEDYIIIRSILIDACKDIPISIRNFAGILKSQYYDFYSRNDFTEDNKLFAALNYMFRNEFSFARPYIAKLGSESITNRSVILQHINNYDTISINELLNICNDHNIQYPGVNYLCQSLAPDYIRINSNMLAKYDLIGISQSIIDMVEFKISDRLQEKDYIVGTKLNSFDGFPTINVEWNEYIIESLLAIGGKIPIIHMPVSPIKQSNAIYVSSVYSNESYDSFLLKVVGYEISRGMIKTKAEMYNWLKTENLIGKKVPRCLEQTRFYYIANDGTYCPLV